MAKRSDSNRGAIAGLIFLVIGWTAIAIWYFLPFRDRATAFPEDYFAAPPSVRTTQPAQTATGATTTPAVVTGFGSMASVDAFVTQDQGYSVVQSDFGVANRLYGRRDFKLAQEKAEALFALRNEGRQGAVYNGYISALGQLGKEENVDSMLNTLRGWQSAYPESHFPVMVEAILRMNLADAIRSGKWTSQIGRAAALGADTNLRQARNLLDKARELEPEDALPAIGLMRAGAAMGLSGKELEAFFEYGYARSPQSYSLWARKLRLLAPNWGGTWADMSAFMERAEQEAKDHPQVELIVADGLVEMHSRGVSGIDLTSLDQWQQLSSIYRRVLAVFPEDLEVLTLYAHRAAQFCPDPKETAEIFDQIGDRYLEGSIWDSLAQYNQARTHAYVKYARATEGPEAEARINKAYELSPDDWYVAYNYGLSLAARNQLNEALEALLRAVNTNPSFVPALNAVAHVYLHLEDHENAAVYANRALVREPLGRLLYEAEALLADAEAGQHEDAGAPLTPHIE